MSLLDSAVSSAQSQLQTAAGNAISSATNQASSIVNNLAGGGGDTFSQALQGLNGSLFNKSTAAKMSAGTPDVIRQLAYKVYVVAAEAQYNGQTGLIIEAWLPETLSTDITATYESPLAQGLNGAMPGLGAVARFMGVNLTTQALTTQVWQGGGHIHFSIPFIFQAETDATMEVIEPLKQLFSLTLPQDIGGGGGLLTAPGPHIDATKMPAGAVNATVGTLSDAGSVVMSTLKGQFAQAQQKAQALLAPVSKALVNSVKNNISLHIGQFMYFPSVIIKDVSPTFDVILATDKNPMRVSVNVNFETFYIPTNQDLDAMFPAAAGKRLNASTGQ